VVYGINIHVNSRKKLRLVILANILRMAVISEIAVLFHFVLFVNTNSGSVLNLRQFFLMCNPHLVRTPQCKDRTRERFRVEVRASLIITYCYSYPMVLRGTKQLNVAVLLLCSGEQNRSPAIGCSELLGFLDLVHPLVF
jgi:hypothetical protein